MRGTTAKRLRLVAKQELVKLAVEKGLRDPSFLDRHLNKLYKNLKRAWSRQSDPKWMPSLKEYHKRRLSTANQ